MCGEASKNEGQRNGCLFHFYLHIVFGLKFLLKIALNDWRPSRPARISRALGPCNAVLKPCPNCGATFGLILRRCSILRGMSPAAWAFPALHAARKTLRNRSPYRRRARARSSSVSGDGLRPAPAARFLRPREQKILLN